MHETNAEFFINISIAIDECAITGKDQSFLVNYFVYQFHTVFKGTVFKSNLNCS